VGAPYPAEFAGAHGKGLGALGLTANGADVGVVEEMLERGWGEESGEAREEWPRRGPKVRRE
jgi:hypothetical protein